MTLMTWDDRFNSSSSFRMAHAEASIAETWGRAASVERKRKTLDKWGENLDLDIADGFAPVTNLGTDPALKTANDLDEIVSSSASDTESVLVEPDWGN